MPALSSLIVEESQSAERSSRKVYWVGEHEHWTVESWAVARLLGRRSVAMSGRMDCILACSILTIFLTGLN
jgi:hypothetical protein